jgi:hypothetical protein
VLEFARRIGLGVDVGDFLEFERSFHGDGILRAAPQEQGVMLLG